MSERLSHWPITPAEIRRLEEAVDIQLAQLGRGPLVGTVLTPQEEPSQSTFPQLLQLGTYDRSFFAALALGRWHIGRVNWGGNKVVQRWQVVVGTESQDPYKRRLLAATIGRYGNVHDGVKGWSVYLPYEQFSFMLEPEQEVEYQLAHDARGRAATFMIGLFAGKLEKCDNQMKFRDEELPAKIMKGFKRNFHFDLGSLRRRQNDSWILYIHKLSQVLGMLVTRPSVYKRPFFRDLSAVWW